MCYEFGELILIGGAYTWRGLFSEFYGLHCITCMIIMSDILKFQIIFTLTSEQYVYMQLKQTDSKRKPEKMVPNFSSHFHGNCTTLDKQNSRTFHGQSQFSMTNIYSINQHSLTPF